MYYSLISVCFGYLLDLLIGDPHWLWHPIRAIGYLINKLEIIFRKLFKSTPRGEILAGVCIVIFVLLLSTGIPLLILIFSYHIHSYFGVMIETIMCYQLFATKSLKTESMKVYKKLHDNDIDGAREAVSMIVGRDTKSLDEQGITKATVETIAENASDGVIAPMIFMIIGGAAFGFFYKAINTMDSMIGYKNERYLYLGRVAAIIDDIVNYLPARLSAYIMIIATAFTRFNTKKAYRIYKRDKYNHASPNSAHTEAVMAGALEVQLAGDAYYFGKLYTKKTIGDNDRIITGKDIIYANRLMLITSIITIIILALIKGGILYLC